MMNLLPGLVFLALAGVLVALLRRFYDPVPWATAGLLAALVLVLLGPALLAGRTVLPVGVLASEAPFRHLIEPGDYGNRLQADLVREVFPAQVEVRRAVKAGAWPLLSARMGTGMPLLADPQAQVLQPLVWLPAALPAADAMAVTLALRAFLALLFTWLLLARLGMARQAALFGALSYGLGGFVVLWLGWPLATSAALLPVALYAVARVAGRGGRRDVLLLAAALFVLLAAGHPESELHVLFAVAVFGAGRVAAQPGWRERLRTVAQGAAAGALALALAAPALLPAALYLPQAERSNEVARARDHVAMEPWFDSAWTADVRPTGYSATRARTALQVSPNAFGNNRFANYWGPNNTNTDASGFAGTLAMAGALAAALAALLAAAGRLLGWRSAATRRRPGEVAMLAVGATSLAVALRLPGVVKLLFSLPLLDSSVTAHGRIRLLVSFALAFLAAAELDRWLSGERCRLRWALAATAVAAAVLWATLGHPPPAGPPRSLDWLRLSSLWVQLAALAVAAGVVVATAVVERRRGATGGRRRAAVVLALVAAAELLFFHLPAWPPMSRGALYAVIPEIAYLQEHQTTPDGHRVMGFQGALLPNVAAVYGLPSPGTAGPLKPAAYESLLAPLVDRPGFGGSDRFVVADSPLYDLLGVRYVVMPYGRRPPPGWARRLRGVGSRVFERPHPLPPLWLPQRAAACRGRWTACLAGIEHFADDARVGTRSSQRTVAQPGVGSEGWSWQAAGGRQRVASYRFLEASWRRARTVLAEPRLLASTVYQDGGWHLLVDTEPRPTFVANGPFVAAFVPTGDHRIDLLYRPPGFLAGMLAAAGALAAAALLPAPPRRLRRRRE